MTKRPLPHFTPLTEGFWLAAQEHKLVVQRCAECGSLRHYPRPHCPDCASEDWAWKQMSGSGTVYTYTVTHRAFHPAWEDLVPYTVVTVDLDEGVRMVGELNKNDSPQVAIGRRVRVEFIDVRGDDDRVMTLPTFRLQ